MCVFGWVERFWVSGSFCSLDLVLYFCSKLYIYIPCMDLGLWMRLRVRVDIACFKKHITIILDYEKYETKSTIMIKKGYFHLGCCFT